MTLFDDLLDTQTLARKLGVRTNTLEKWRVRGDGPSYLRLGRRIAYDIRDVEAWLNTRRAASTSTNQPRETFLGD